MLSIHQNVQYREAIQIKAVLCFHSGVIVDHYKCRLHRNKHYCCVWGYVRVGWNRIKVMTMERWAWPEASMQASCPEEKSWWVKGIPQRPMIGWWQWRPFLSLSWKTPAVTLPGTKILSFWMFGFFKKFLSISWPKHWHQIKRSGREAAAQTCWMPL